MNNSKESIKQLRKKCQDKGDGRFYADWTEHMPRFFSIYLTKIFLSIGISANQITILSIILGLLTGILLGLGKPFFVILAALVIFVVPILDCSDGEVSRYRGKNSYSGEYFDRMAGAIIDPAVLFGISIFVYKQTGELVDIIAGFVGGFSLILIRLSVSHIYACSFSNLSNMSISIKKLSDINNSSFASKKIERIIDTPKIAKDFSLVNFASDLFLIKTWGMIYWIWLAGIVAFLSLFFSYNLYLTEWLRSIIWLYAIFSPLGVCYIIYKAVKNKIPDRLATDFKK